VYTSHSEKKFFLVIVQKKQHQYVTGHAGVWASEFQNIGPATEKAR